MNLFSMKTICVLLVALFTVFQVSAADKGVFSTTPKLNNGEKWRIGYYEGGEYIDYQKIFTETVRGLMKLGWIETMDIPEQKGEQTKELWGWLNTNMQSEYIDFLPDAHYSANWDEKLRQELSIEIIERLNTRKDIDLLIAMGTWAGKDMANDLHKTNTMVLSASDPIVSGIIKSVQDSGYGHLHAQVDPYRYERQTRVFHEIIEFKKLGVAYENTVNGKSYAAIDVIEKLAKERKFDLVRCYTQSDIADVTQAEQSVIECFGKLVNEADAIYVTVQGGINKRSIPKLVKIANKNKIPTFSQSGSEEVKNGFFVSLSQAGFRYVGEYHAETFAKVFNGANPNQLDQLFQEPPKIAINMKTAELIGFDPPVVLLGAADEIYREIEEPKD